MSRVLTAGLVTLLGLSLLPGVATAATKAPSVTITLSPSLSSPQMLGTSILWTATVQGGPPGDTYDYQFSAALQGQNQIVRDFGSRNTFTWVPYTVEGTYVVTVVVRDITQQPYTVYPPVSVQYVLNPWVTSSGGSAVNRTAHPLVALFSAGSCTSGHSIRIRFHQSGAPTSSTTNAVPCSQSSANFLVAGMLPSTQYLMHWEEFATGFLTSGPDQPFTTGPLPTGFPVPQMTVKVPPTGHDAAFPVLLFHLIPPTGRPFAFRPIATDLSGNVLWYYPVPLLMDRMEPGGNFFSLNNTTLNEYDLAGNKTLETNVEILNEQLLAKGYPVMTSFNAHEVRRLPSGGLLLIGARDIVSTTLQGGTQQNPVDILGDMVLVLDHNMQLTWAWDSFAHQDVSRVATLNDKCFQNLGAGCPAFNPAFGVANDWLHSNSVQLTADGNILLSERSQDWVLKINYNNGQGDGRVLWKLGPFGDFTITNPPPHPCGDPNVYPWFTHQHDAAFQIQSGALEVFTAF
ncbi:MAG TPA: aryl-sulfate sulfotransferase, partial [Candidatus Limnocylindrales bacterium]|nr:aryl-sulfate sulfotransferase [Candidatus Limnocylindrales bacterium]